MQLRARAFAFLLSVFVPAVSLLVPRVGVAQTDTASDSEARALFEQGRTAYDAGHFDEAVRAFRRAYVLSPRFPLLYNIGQAELRAGHDALALDAFQGFLRQSPADDARRSEVEERIRVLQAMGIGAPTRQEVQTATATETGTTVTETQTETTVETTTATESGTSETESTSESESESESESASDGGGGPGVVPWVIVGVGAALAIAGGVLMGVGADDAGRVTGAMRGASWADLSGAASDANTLWGVGIGLLITGVVAAGVGIVWGVAGGGGSSSESGATARLRLGPGGLSLEGEF
jgi:tetratricopeptide (TPR) repeat protein